MIMHISSNDIQLNKPSIELKQNTTNREYDLLCFRVIGQLFNPIFQGYYVQIYWDVWLIRLWCTHLKQIAEILP